MNVFLHSSRLKNLVPVICLFLAGCQTDLLIPCSGPDSLNGEICREFVEVDDNPVGTVEYTYDALNRVQSRVFRNTGNSIQKTITYSYTQNNLASVEEEVNGLSSITAFGFNEMDSLVSVAYFFQGQIDSILFIDRLGEKREAERLEIDGVTHWTKEYRYRQSDGILDRVSFYDSTSSLLYYDRYEFFQDGSQRIEKRSADHLLVNKTVIRRNQAGNPTLVEVKDPLDIPIRTTNFVYDADGRKTSAELIVDLEVRKTTYLYY